MPITHYDAIVPTKLQILRSIRTLLDKAEAHCTDHGWNPEQVIGARLAPDMFDFAYQVKSCYTHSLMAIEKAQEGEFSPNLEEAPRSFDGLRALVDQAIAGLEALSPDAVNAIEGQPADFRFKSFHMPFTAENFLLSFSQPNFHFHASMTYAILRMLGVKIGKMDYLGGLRLRDLA